MQLGSQAAEWTALLVCIPDNSTSRTDCQGSVEAKGSNMVSRWEGEQAAMAPVVGGAKKTHKEPAMKALG